MCVFSVEDTPVDWMDGWKEAIIQEKKEGHVNEKVIWLNLWLAGSLARDREGYHIRGSGLL